MSDEILCNDCRATEAPVTPGRYQAPYCAACGYHASIGRTSAVARDPMLALAVALFEQTAGKRGS
jgi:hypothetical protein